MSENRIPTGGRAVLKPDGTSEYVRFYDKPLSRDEETAVAWFTELSPFEQLREVRKLKWNLDQSREDTKTWKDSAHQSRLENARLTAERNARRPDGYELPRAASQLLDHAEVHGWQMTKGWYPDEDGAYARLTVLLGKGGWTFRLSWTVPVNGNGAGALTRTGLARAPRRGWYDAPPLKRIREIITEVGTGSSPDPA